MTTINVKKELSFANGIKVTSNSGPIYVNPVNSVYFYDDVYTDGQSKVDALITLTSLDNADIGAFDSPDYPYLNSNNFQPLVFFRGGRFGSDPTAGSASFNVQFIEDGSFSPNAPMPVEDISFSGSQVLLRGNPFYTGVTLTNLVWENYDVDGLSIDGKPSKSRQYVETNQYLPNYVITYPQTFDPFNPEVTSDLAVSYRQGSVRAQSVYGGDSEGAPGTLEYDRHRVSIGLAPTSSFNFTYGDETNTTQYTGAFSMNFSPKTTKFFVVDDKADKNFSYDPSNTLLDTWALNYPGNKYPRDVAATPNGSTVWVLDKSKKVNLYSSNGTSKGVWEVYNTDSDPEGIAFDNYNSTNSIWVASQKGQIQWFSGGAAYSNGKYKSDATFSVNIGKDKLKGIVTDFENNLWAVVDGYKSSDKIYHFKIARSGNTPTELIPFGVWNISGSGVPTGITLDAQQSARVGDLWVVVDDTVDRVLKFKEARGYDSDVPLPDPIISPLAPGNTSPQGIADPRGLDTAITSYSNSFFPLTTPTPLVNPYEDVNTTWAYKQGMSMVEQFVGIQPFPSAF